ncbi:ATP-binding protein [Cystobacter fuscus]|uniref:hybrid sensor histidine kinase/response regulator n=1 Tax=Cystobacter fuscus TaxID=43 RepID=UPI0037C1020A
MGPIESWPLCLRTVVSLCVASPFPILIAWGPRRVMLFNDGCRALSGGPPPHLLGQPLGQYWGAAWAEVRGHYDKAFASQPVILENQPLFRDRGGLLQETFLSGAFSPIRNESGEIVGVWNPLTETTRQVLNERRTRALRDVAMAMANAQTLPEVFTLAARTLEKYERDLPFTLFYARGAGGSTLRLVSSTGLPHGTAASPSVLFSHGDTAGGWPLEEVMRTGQPVRVGHLVERFGPLRCGPYPEPPREAVALPIRLPGEEEPTALLLTGVSSRLEWNEPYLEFHRLLASAVSTAALQCHAREEQRRRTGALAELDRIKAASREQQVRHQQEQLYQLLTQAPAAIAVFKGPEHVFEFVNNHYQEFTRHRPLLGKPVREVYPELEGQGLFELLDQVYRSGEPFMGQELAARVDLEGNGRIEEFFLNITYQPLRGSDGRISGVMTSHFNVTDWVKSRRWEEQHAAQLEAVIQSIPDGVCIADTSGHIRTNRIDPAILGSSGIADALQRALRGESSTREVYLAQAGSEKQRVIRSATAPVRLRESIVGAVSINVDITERKRAEAEREVLLANEQAARSEAERANRKKDEFLARVSHELATPLVGMRLWLELLQTDPGRSTEAISALTQCTQSQSRIVHDLLDTARALSGKLSVMLEACEPGEPIQAAVSDLMPLARQKGLALEMLLQETPLVQADPRRMRQVVSNLLSNAVKFTPPGGKVEVRLEPERGGVCIVVQDTGRGFPSEFQPLLFSPFRQEEEGTTRANGGLGLGLAIVRQLVELQGGTVWAESPGRGQGAIFTVWLPAHEDTGEPLRAENTSAVALQLEGLRLLLVEDDALTRTAVASILEHHGARVEAVESTVAALSVLGGTSGFDALVCDIAMPQEDGYSLIRKVRAMSGPISQVPAAAFTAHMREEDRLQVLEAGFQMHIPKSLEPDQLIAQLRTLVGERPAKS